MNGFGRAGLLALFLQVAASSPARPQLFDAWSLDSGIPFDRALPSARLQSLGGMREAVPDENNEINLLDFAGNLAGHLDDKPSGHLDAFTGSRTWFDRTRPSLSDQDYKVFPTAVRLNLLPGSHYALGGSMEYANGNASRLVSPYLRRRFALPVENPAVGAADGSLVESQLRSPAFTAHYVLRMGRLAAGLEAGYAKENEDRRAVALYEINHGSSTLSARASLATQVVQNWGKLRNWVLGANGRLAKAQIDGLSESLLHRDVFDWQRPSVGFQIHLLGQVAEAVKGGLDFRYDSFEGQETVDMNWSAQFPLNPTSTTIRIQRSAFEEGFRSSRLRTRWMLQPPGGAVAWGAALESRQQEFWQTAAPNANAFVSTKAERLTDWRGTAGGSYFLPRGRGLVAGELSYGWADRDDLVRSRRRTVGASALEVGGGGELAVALPVVLRAGYRLLKDDGDRDRENPESEITTHRLALGAGYRTPNAALLLDFGFAYDFCEPGAGGGGAQADAVEGQDRKALTFQVRSVF